MLLHLPCLHKVKAIKIEKEKLVRNVLKLFQLIKYQSLIIYFVYNNLGGFVFF